MAQGASLRSGLAIDQRHFWIPAAQEKEGAISQQLIVRRRDREAAIEVLDGREKFVDALEEIGVFSDLDGGRLYLPGTANVRHRVRPAMQAAPHPSALHASGSAIVDLDQPTERFVLLRPAFLRAMKLGNFLENAPLGRLRGQRFFP